MKILELSGVAIEGVCACLPKNAIANDEKIAKTTGIVTRRIVPKGVTVVDLCVKAAEKALADAGAKPDDFGAIVFVSFTQHQRMPASAAQAQARLGFPKDVLAFDVSLACSGWAYGLYLAGLLARQTGKKVLLLDGDVQSAFLDPSDTSTVSLLADGGTATIVGSGSNGADAWRFAFGTDGEKGEALKLEHGGTLAMDGFAVFKFVATDVVAFIREFLQTSQTLQTFSFVPHQPNVFMVRQLAKSVGIDEGRTAISCDAFGNLSSASIPATIAAKGVRGKALVAGFGGGLSISAGLIDIPASASLSLVGL